MHAGSFLAAINCTADDVDCLYLRSWEDILVAQEAAKRFLPIDEPVSAFMQLLPSGAAWHESRRALCPARPHCSYGERAGGLGCAVAARPG